MWLFLSGAKWLFLPDPEWLIQPDPNTFCIFIIGFDSGFISGMIIYGISCIAKAAIPMNDIPT